MITTDNPTSYFIDQLKVLVAGWPQYSDYAFFVWPLERVEDPSGAPFVRVHVTNLGVNRMTIGPIRQQPSDMRMQVTFNFLGSELVAGQLVSGADGLEAYLRGQSVGGITFGHGSVAMLNRSASGRYQQVNLSVQCRMIRRVVL